MALSDTDKMRIVTLLGWPAKTLIIGSTHFSSWINDKLVSLTTPAEDLISDLLTRIENIDTKLSTDFGKDNVQKVDDITFFGNNLNRMRSERKKVLCELSDITTIPDQRSCGPNIGVCN